MSISEMAREEADRVEAEEEAPPEGEPQPDPEPQPDDEPSSNAQMEKALAQMEKENARHTAAVEKIMGEDFQLVYPCQHCQDFAAGFTFTAPDSNPPMVHPDEFKRCDKCNGHGAILTGALTQHGATQTCLACNGQGYRQEAIQPDVQPTAIVAPAAAMNPNHSMADQLRAAGYTVLDPYNPAA